MKFDNVSLNDECAFLFQLCGFKKITFLLFFMIASATFEIFSIGCIYFFMNFLSNPFYIENSKFLTFLSSSFLIQSQEHFLIFLGTMVFVCLTSMNLFNAYNAYLINKFGYTEGAKLQTKLLTTYLNRKYEYFININSSELAKNILNEGNRVISGILVNILQSIARGIILLSILSTMFFIQPIITLLIGIFFFFIYFIIYRSLKKKLNYAGLTASNSAEKKYRIVHETFNSIKEILILNRKKKIINEFSITALEHSKAESLNQVTTLITKYFLEIVAFGAIILILFCAVLNGKTTHEILPILGIFAFSGYRLLPAAQQLFSGFTLARYNWNSLEKLTKEFYQTNNFEKSTHETSSDSTLIKNFKKINLFNISYKYPGSTQHVISNTSMAICRNKITAIFGQTGSGKTTLLDLVLGLLESYKGEMIVDDSNKTLGLIHIFPQKIGYVSQNIRLVDDTILNNIAFGLPKIEVNISKAIAAAKLAHIHDFISELPLKYETIVGENGIRLSGGQRQRIVIARALYHEPELIIFDEATSALDNITESKIIKSLKNISEEKTILIVTHRINTLKNCDMIHLIENGIITASGAYSDLYKKNALFRSLENSTNELLNPAEKIN